MVTLIQGYKTTRADGKDSSVWQVAAHVGWHDPGFVPDEQRRRRAGLRRIMGYCTQPKQGTKPKVVIFGATMNFTRFRIKSQGERKGLHADPFSFVIEYGY